MKKSWKRRLGFNIIALTVIILCVLLIIGKSKLEKQYKDLQGQQSSLEQQIEDEKERTEEIEEYSVYIKTKRFIKDLANSVMGLVNPDDIIIKEEK